MKDLTKGSMPKNLLIYAIPAILAGILSRTHSIVDSIMVGKFLGTNGLAAIGCMNSFRTVLSSLLWGAGMGIAVYIGSLVSTKKNSQAVRALKSNYSFLFLITIIISALAIILYKPLFSIFSVKQEIYNDAFIYYAILIACEVATVGHSLITNTFYAFGNSKFSMIASAISCALNIGLNYLFIKIIPLGVLGAALATFISIFSVFIFGLFRMRKECRILSNEKQPFKIYKEDIKEGWKMAIPCMIQQGVMYISSAVIQPSINTLNSSAIAAYSICIQLYDICTIFFYSASKGLTTVCTQCYGKGKVNLINKCFFISSLQGILLSAPIAIIMIIFPNTVASLFLQEGDLLTASYIARYITLCFPFIALATMTNCYHSFFRGVLKPIFATITTAVYTIARIGFSLALLPSLEMDGVYWGFTLAWATELIVCVIIHLSKKWKTAEFKKMENSLKSAKENS